MPEHHPHFTQARLSICYVIIFLQSSDKKLVEAEWKGFVHSNNSY